jgi:hypothetical protein
LRAHAVPAGTAFFCPAALKNTKIVSKKGWIGLVFVLHRKTMIMKKNNSQDESRARQQQGGQPQSNTVKNPDDWTTGDEEMTGAQRSYLKTLSDEAGEEMNDNLSKAEASKRIDELQDKTGRGKE